MHEACQDPLFRRFLRGYLDEEATPTLPPVPGIDLAAYKAELVEPVRQPGDRATPSTGICAEASDRIPQFLLPVLRANLASGGEIRRSVAVLAGWARSAEGDGRRRPADRARRPAGRAALAAARRQADDPLAFVADRELFGDLVDDDPLRRTYRATLESLRTRGARATLEEVLRRA